MAPNGQGLLALTLRSRARARHRPRKTIDIALDRHSLTWPARGALILNRRAREPDNVTVIRRGEIKNRDNG